MTLTIGMVAHDSKKPDLVSWAERHARSIGRHRIVATATTGGLLRVAMPEAAIRLVKSGPLGGDQQIGAMIAQGELDILLFFPEPLAAQPHDVDVKALLRLVLVYNIPAAFSPSTATALAGSGLFDQRKR
ncbi:methylglyoxal synthase [Bosea sp. UNC402CLCol]|uniref:methylglyoxal synthase n=1 Tax=Bosea sp. UNC402CLCol TaxID=1510531 RepID=UPI00056EE53F|nr:methylglyoxal synthase [Bosea sp. UNC402CLCol]